MRIEIWEGNSHIEDIEKPVEESAGRYYVRYNGRDHEIKNGNQVWLTGNAPLKPPAALAADPPSLFPKGAKPQLRPHNSPAFLKTKSEPKIRETPNEDTAPWSWDAEQARIISAAANIRMLVNACPGSGKTAIACARVAHLLEEGAIANEIWMLSLTRIAVAEIQKRIRLHLRQPFRANGVHIATINSFAWQLNRGFNSSPSITGDYDKDIATTTQMLEVNPLLQAWLKKNISHLLIDEAQDIEGVRSEFLIRILSYLGPDCGVTILCDDAQAIYNFTNDRSRQSSENVNVQTPPLPGIIRKTHPPFETRSLTKVYRTANKHLCMLYTDTRDLVLTAGANSLQGWRNVCSKILSSATSQYNAGFDFLHLGGVSNSPASVFALFRASKEALLAAASIPDGFPFRLYIGGIADELPPWLGALPLACESQFLHRRDVQRELSQSGKLFPENIWELLGGSDGAEYLHIKTLNQISTFNLAPDLLKKELGMAGPLLSTIHAAKGREADQAHLYLPEYIPSDNFEEECRVIFVGASRARKSLIAHGDIATSKKRWHKYKYSGKHLYDRNGTETRFAFGFYDEISARTLAGKDLYPTSQEACNSQQALKKLALRFLENPAPEIAELHLAGDRYALHDSAGNLLCFLEESVTTALASLLRDAPASLSGLRIMDVVTCKAPAGIFLHEPWNRLRFLLKPRIFGFPDLRG